MKLLIVFFILATLLSPTVFAENWVIKIKNFAKKNKYKNYDGVYIPDAKIIEINGYMYEGVFQEGWYKETLRHEVRHAICDKLFGDVFCNDETWRNQHPENER